MSRRLNFQTISWFYDQHQRSLLNLDPKYQRRSVWPLSYKEDFIDTILLEYPVPSIFLFEEIQTTGRTINHVVDGKQRLTAVFEFAEGQFPVSDSFANKNLRGKTFEQLDPQTKTAFWSYQLTVDYLPSDKESILKEVFERINKNIAKLSPQELRHARLDGEFIRAAEDLTRWLAGQLPQDVPRMPSQIRAQMKDVEFTAQLLLHLEEGNRSHSQDELDEAFVLRDSFWHNGNSTQARFREIMIQIAKIFKGPNGDKLIQTRLHNQADFYSLFGAIAKFETANPPIEKWKENLLAFVKIVDDEKKRRASKEAEKYFKAARSNSNDQTPRRDRIEVLTSILRDGLPVE